MDYDAGKIRNVALFGHQGSGKTSLVESLYQTVNKGEKGTIEKGNTVSDYLKEEKKRLSSVSTSIVPINYNGYKINLLDVPGNDDFIAESIAVAHSVKGAILVIDAQSKVQVGTIKAYKLLRKRGIPFLIYVNKMDKDYPDYEEILENIYSKLGKMCIPFTLPLGHSDKFDGFINCVDLKARRYTGTECVDDVIYDDKKTKVFEFHNRICEAVAVTDDSLLEKFFGGEALTHDEIHNGLRQGVLNGEIYPIIFGSAQNDIGIHTLLSMLIDYLPSPSDLKPYIGVDDEGKDVTRKTLSAEPFSGYIFKTLIDPYLGQINYMKVDSGVLKVGQEVYCPNLNKNLKISSILSVCGKNMNAIDEVGAGDICCLSKLTDLETSFTLSDKDKHVKYNEIDFPTAVFFKAIELANKKDDDKINSAIAKILKEEKTIEVRRNVETKQLLLGGLSETHVNYILQKIKGTYGVELTTAEPKICYRETITKAAEGDGRYIKQSGGSGFYGVVKMRFEPAEEISFEEQIFGGAVPKNYFPSIEKGFYEALNQGLLAGFPVIKCKAILLDGKYHPVDSNELAFKMASILAFKDAYMNAKPTILEPILNVSIYIGNEYLGDVLNDLNSRRGRIQNIIDKEDETTSIEVLLPEAETLDYVTKLKVLTQGSGYFVREFYAYEEVPAQLREKVIKENSLLNK
ncbi:MAG: elongation factor G [Candidatus Onthovivens sp.]